MADITVRINKIVDNSYVDGPGCRTVVFFQGCAIGCKGCQNRALWPFDGGSAVKVNDLARDLAERAGVGGNVTISGGEPFAQPAALAALVIRLKNIYKVGHIIVYTGYEFDTLFDVRHPASIWLFSILQAVDVIVDGPFVKALDDKFISYRGSRNQRPIKVKESMGSGRIVTDDWDSLEIVITNTGDVLLPVGLAPEFQDLGKTNLSRRCGQTTEVKK